MRRVPWAALGPGFVVFALGIAAAMRWLPEWRSGTAPPGNVVRSAAERLRKIGGTLTGARLVRAFYGEGGSVEKAYRLLGPAGAGWLARSGAAAGLVVTGDLAVEGAGSGPANVVLDADGEFQLLNWVPGGSIFEFAPPDAARQSARERFVERFALLLARGKELGAEETYGGNPVFHRRAILGAGGPAEAVVRMETANNALVGIGRDLVDPAAPVRSTGSALRRLLPRLVPVGLIAIAVLLTFGVLLSRKRVSFRIGLPLSALALLSMLLGGIPNEHATNGSIWVAVLLAGYAVTLVFLLVLWVVAESLLRETVPGFTTSLDAFVAGRLGPRGGRALLGGLGVGAAAAGVQLLVLAVSAAAFAPQIRPTTFSFAMPLLTGTGSPFFEGPYDTAFFILFAAVLRFVLPRAMAESAAALAFALLASTEIPLAPWGAAFAVSLALATLFLASFRTFGLAALLVTATTARLLIATFAVGRFAATAPVTFLLCAVAVGGIVVLGLVSLSRPEREEEGRIQAPEYIQRVESERRVKYEMDLLSRMQLAMLPDHPPQVSGLDISVRTVLATEAGGDLYEFIEDGGGLWIAAGDVSGHGYSCGIQGAMVKAALLSLARDGRSPAAVLWEVDRVLRAAKAGRLFTSLALLKLDPKSGRGVLANAGHPFPLLVADGKCREVQGSGLPLGQGPPRSYTDVAVELPEGASLVFASDGLYEGPDRFDDPYGYQRPSAVLESIGLWRRPADAIVEALFADWRDHVGDGAPADDTTVLVVKRPALAW